MKTKEEIESRLVKLSTRYRRIYIQDQTSKLPHNCYYNYECEPKPLPYLREVDTYLSPRRSNSLVIVNDDKPIRVCTHGSSDPSKWNGNVCDDESTSRDCPYFKAHKSVEVLEEEFTDLLKDDHKVLESYPDLASLQWVLNDRVYKLNISPSHLLMQFWVFIKSWFRKS